MKALNVLYIEDNPRDTILIDRALNSEGFQVSSRVVDDEPGIQTALEQQAWDLVISDCHLPMIQIERVLELIHDFDKNLPFIAVSGAISEEDAVDIMKGGAHDFVSKGNLTRLVPAINRELEEAENRRARALAEYHLRESEERFQLAMKGASDGLWDWDMVTNRVYFSDRWCEMLGYTAKDIGPCMETYRSLIHIDDASRVFRSIDKYVKKELERFEVEFKMNHRDGSVVHVLSRAFFVESLGVPRRMVGTHVDITSQKQHELALTQSKNQLRELSAHLQKVREEEKSYIAQEVHDQLGATLTALNFNIHWLQKKLTSAPRDIQTKTADMASLIETAAQSCRQIVTELRPSVLDDLGLYAALEWQANDFSRRNDIPCKVVSNVKELNLSPEQSIVVFRIFQESLTNVARHAQASRVDVVILKSGDNFTLQVIDDGVGFVVKKNDDTKARRWRDQNDDAKQDLPVKNGSYGVRGMRERAVSVNGHFRMDCDGAGNGTRVILTLPLTAELGKNAENISC